MDEPLVDAFVERAEGEIGSITQQQLDGGWQRLRLAKLASAGAMPWRQRRGPRAWPWLAGFAVAGVAVAVFAIVRYRALSAQPLQYMMEGLVTRRGDAIEASPHSASRLLFSDESRIVLDPSTRLTVGRLDARGASIDLLDGSLDVSVRSRPNGSWLFSAGPFVVHVTGTSFRLAFAPSLGRMNLQMTSGHVEVLAPQKRTMTVGAGESIELFTAPPASAGAAAMTAATPDHEDAASAAETRPPATNRHHAAPDSARRRVAALLPTGAPPSPATRDRDLSSTEPSLAWVRWLREGRFAQVVADAEQRGVDRVIAQARPADMAALADAARYIKRYSLSRHVLLTMRSRFAATESANDASFFLGRLAEVTSGAEPALTWYDTYLRDAPHGLYAKEAMGREMRLGLKGRPEETSRIARQYLERFPQGPEADLARALGKAKPE